MTDPSLTYALPPADHKSTASHETENFLHLSHVVRLSPSQETYQTCSPQATPLEGLSEGKEKRCASFYKCDSSSQESLQHELCSKDSMNPSVAAPKDKVNRLEENVCQATKNDTKVFQVLSQQRRHTRDMEHSYGCDSVQTDFSLLLNSVNINGRDPGSEHQQCQLTEAPLYDNLFRSAQTIQAHTQSLCLPTQAPPSSSHKAQQQLLHSSSAICTSAPTLADHSAFSQTKHHSPASNKSDHDLKQMQIQHSLEGKIKQLSIALILEPESVSHPDPDKDTTASSQQAENTQEVQVMHPASASQNQDTSETVGMQIQITNVHSLSTTCSFYDNDDDHFLPSLQSLDNADPPPSTTVGFHTNGIETTHSPTHNDDEVLFHSQHSLTFPPHSMEQYLLDVDELPQFSNIPTDTNDMICCTDTMHLTPTIPPNAVHFDWQHPWYDHTPKKDASKDISNGLPTATMTSSLKEEAMDQAHQLSGAVKVSIPVLYVPATINSSTVKHEKQQAVWPHSEQQMGDEDGQVSMQDCSPHTLPSSTEGTPAQAPLQKCLSQGDAAAELSQATGHANHAHSFTPLLSKDTGCPSSFLSPPPSVEMLTCLSNSGTPGPEDSGYLTMDEQELVSQSSTYWQQPHLTDKMDGTTSFRRQSGTSSSCSSLSGPAGRGPGGGGRCSGGGRGSHCAPLHNPMDHPVQMAGMLSDDVAYYPFSDLMQLHPSLLGDQEPSIHYIPNTPTHFYPLPQQTVDKYPPPQPPQPSARRRRQGPSRGQSAQIQSDQITSSLQKQQQEHPSTATTYTKRPYKRRASCMDTKQRQALIKHEASKDKAEISAGEKRARHNEPLNQKAVSIMFEWYCQNEENPYPSKEEKERMAREGGITTMQVKSWFANKRNRSNNTRPKVQKRAMEEKLMQICNHLSREKTSCVQQGDNSFIIKELSQIIHTFEKDSS